MRRLLIGGHPQQSTRQCVFRMRHVSASWTFAHNQPDEFSPTLLPGGQSMPCVINTTDHGLYPVRNLSPCRVPGARCVVWHRCTVVPRSLRMLLSETWKLYLGGMDHLGNLGRRKALGNGLWGERIDRVGQVGRQGVSGRRGGVIDSRRADSATNLGPGFVCVCVTVINSFLSWAHAVEYPGAYLPT